MRMLHSIHTIKVKNTLAQRQMADLFDYHFSCLTTTIVEIFNVDSLLMGMMSENEITLPG